MNQALSENFISRFDDWCQKTPQRLALAAVESGSDTTLTYQQLASEAAFWQKFWLQQGFGRGDRVVIALQPGLHNVAITISLLASGLVPVFIDTAMPRLHVRYVLDGSSPVAVIGPRRALRWHWLVPQLKRCRRFSADGVFPGLTALPLSLATEARDSSRLKLCVESCGQHDHAIISFTSENRGIPMGADRTHDSLHQLHLAMEKFWPHSDGDVDSTCFPLVALHNLSSGMSTILPDIDFSAPGQLTKKRALRVLKQFAHYQVTRLSGAPAYFSALCDCMEEHNIRLPEIEALTISRATVGVKLARRLQIRFPQAQAQIVYGATEAEPVCAITLDDYLKADNDSGYLVGAAVDDIELVVCRALPERNLNEDGVLNSLCQPGETGEILVAGPHVLDCYINNPAAAMENKIPRSLGSEKAAVWHRTGDTGYLDEDGQLWLTGRIKDLVYPDSRVIHPYVYEKQIDKHPSVRRCALIQSGPDNIRLYLVCDESLEDLLPGLEPVLRSLAVAPLDIYRLTVMPVDRRHNSKVDRQLLRLRSRRIHATEYQRWTGSLH